MSYTFLQEGGAESSAESFSDIPAFVLSRLNLTHEKSSCNGSETESSPRSQSGTMLEPSTENLGGERLTSFAEASHVRTSAPKAAAKELMEADQDYGPRWPESFARFNPNTSLWKTAQHSLFEGLEEFTGTWPRFGMMIDGECSELANLDSHIHGKDCFYWPTPLKSDTKGDGPSERNRNTPHMETELKRRLGIPLTETRRLNPCWLEKLMGWPTNWTALQPLETAKFQQWLDSHGKH